MTDHDVPIEALQDAEPNQPVRGVWREVWQQLYLSLIHI